MSQIRPLTAAQSPTSSAPFKYVAGDVALDFVNTVDWTTRGLEHERLTSYARLIEWADGAGLVSRATAARLRAAASQAAHARDAAFGSALALRAALQRLLAAASASRVDGDALRAFDAFVAPAFAQRTLAARTDGRAKRAAPRFAWAWRDAESLDVIAWSVAAQAAALLTSDDVARIRLCAGDDCGWFFVDRSRNGLRRWCQMEVCGMKEKNQRRATR
jgi:predicted RNA-binding Zn ribbon-like protein